MLKWYKKQGVTIRAAIIGGGFAILAAIFIGVFELFKPNPPIVIYFSPTETSLLTPSPTIEVIPSLTPLTPTQIILTPTGTSRRVLYEVDFSFYEDETYECANFEFFPTENARHVHIKCLHTEGSSTLPILLLDFDLHLTAQKVRGSNRARYGVVLLSERNGKYIFHRFLISGLGTYIYEVATVNKDGEQTDLEAIVPETISPAIIPKDGTNFIQLIRKRSVIEFRVNDQILLIIDTSIDANEEIRIRPSVITQTEDRGGDNFVEIAFKDLVIYEVP